MSSSKSSNSELAALPRHRHVVSAGEGGQRLDLVLSRLPEVISREMARRLIDAGWVSLNQCACKPAARVQAADLIEFAVPAPTLAGVRPQAGPLEILYEDGDLIVVNKPAGLSVHPGPGHPDGTLVNRLLHHCRDLSGIGGVLRPGIVHRLDKDTSGVLVAAKHDLAHQGLAAQFKAHTVHRRYLAITVGVPPRRQGTIDLPLARERSHRLRRGVHPGGKPAVTHYTVRETLGHFALLELRLETGRTHQIRAHLAARDWPVLGDPLYGGRRHRGLTLPETLGALLSAFQRQALHAAELGFIHPVLGSAQRFSSPPPADLQTVLDAVRAAC